MSRVARRDFLKTVPAAAGVYLAGGVVIDAETQTKAPRPADVRLSGTAYQPVPDYPIRPTPYFEVKLTDTFWKPKVATNAEVTIPFEMQKAGETGRGLSRNVLEAAMLSLKTHPDPQLQAQVEARVRELTEAQTGATATAGSRPPRPTTTPPGSVTCWTARSPRPMRCTAISWRTIRRFPAASGTPSTACSCIEPRTTRSISIWPSTTSISAASRTR